MMVDNRVEGMARNIGEPLKGAVVRLTNDTDHDRVSGNAQDLLGAAKDVVDDWIEAIGGFTRDKPVAALCIAASAGFVLRMVTRASK